MCVFDFGIYCFVFECGDVMVWGYVVVFVEVS